VKPYLHFIDKYHLTDEGIMMIRMLSMSVLVTVLSLLPGSHEANAQIFTNCKGDQCFPDLMVPQYYKGKQVQVQNAGEDWGDYNVKVQSGYLHLRCGQKSFAHWNYICGYDLSFEGKKWAHVEISSGHDFGRSIAFSGQCNPGNKNKPTFKYGLSKVQTDSLKHIVSDLAQVSTSDPDGRCTFMLKFKEFGS